MIWRVKAGLVALAGALVRRLPARKQAVAHELVGRYGVMRLPNYRVTRRFVARFGLRVRRGPFAGLVFPQAVVGRNPFLTSKLIGSYELELHPWIESLVSRPFALVANIGAADGYYVAGLAMRMPDTRVIAWEANPLHARLARLTAEMNGVGARVEVRGHCGVQDLAAVDPTGPLLVVIDAEGAEDELLDPDKVPALRAGTMLVEAHEMYAPGVIERLRDRFEATHTIHEQVSRPRYRDDYPELYELRVDNFERDLATSESRPGLTPWLLIEPRDASDSGKGP